MYQAGVLPIPNVRLVDGRGTLYAASPGVAGVVLYLPLLTTCLVTPNNAQERAPYGLMGWEFHKFGYFSCGDTVSWTYLNNKSLVSKKSASVTGLGPARALPLWVPHLTPSIVTL